MAQDVAQASGQILHRSASIGRRPALGRIVLGLVVAAVKFVQPGDKILLEEPRGSRLLIRDGRAATLCESDHVFGVLPVFQGLHHIDLMKRDADAGSDLLLQSETPGETAAPRLQVAGEGNPDHARGEWIPVFRDVDRDQLALPRLARQHLRRRDLHRDLRHLAGRFHNAVGQILHEEGEVGKGGLAPVGVGGGREMGNTALQLGSSRNSPDEVVPLSGEQMEGANSPAGEQLLDLGDDGLLEAERSPRIDEGRRRSIVVDVLEVEMDENRAGVVERSGDSGAARKERIQIGDRPRQQLRGILRIAASEMHGRGGGEIPPPQKLDDAVPDRRVLQQPIGLGSARVPGLILAVHCEGISLSLSIHNAAFPTSIVAPHPRPFKLRCPRTR